MPTLMRHRLRSWSLIAFLAIFGLAFAPTVSHALAHANGDASFQAVCTTLTSPEGSNQGEAPASGDPVTVLVHLSHCPLCGLAAQALATPPTLPPFATAKGLTQALQPSLRPTPPLLFAWAQAQPRAPPSLG